MPVSTCQSFSSPWPTSTKKLIFTVAIFVVHDGKILLIHHRKLNKWLPLGGHIELDEDLEQATLREAKEESGLDVELLGERPPTTSPGTRALIAPRFLDIHRINDTPEHIGMIYWARPAGHDGADEYALPRSHLPRRSITTFAGAPPKIWKNCPRRCLTR